MQNKKHKSTLHQGKKYRNNRHWKWDCEMDPNKSIIKSLNKHM